MHQLNIQKYCHIKNNKLFVDGKLIFSDDKENSLAAFLKLAYKSIAPTYNKFFKMDEISKLAFIAAEVLLKDINLENYKPEDISIVLSNSDSTLVTDKNHQQTIVDDNNFFPSPKIFVYTLPNIMIGEIAIRHKFKGENAFFIVENFSEDLMVVHINSLFLANKTKAAVGGWVNQSGTDYEAFLFFVSPSDGIRFNALEIKRLHNINY